jgi:hypothetical protein
MPDVKPDIKERKPATQDESEVPDGKVQITVILGEQSVFSHPSSCYTRSPAPQTPVAFAIVCVSLAFKYAVKPTTAFKKVFETTEVHDPHSHLYLCAHKPGFAETSRGISWDSPFSLQRPKIASSANTGRGKQNP